MASKAKAFFTGLGLGAAKQATKEVIARQKPRPGRTEADIWRDLEAAHRAKDEALIKKYSDELAAFRRSQNKQEATPEPVGSKQARSPYPGAVNPQ